MLPQSIKAYDKAGLRSLIEQFGQPAYRARQIAAWLYGQGIVDPPTSFEQMTDLPQSLRQKLAQNCSMDTPLVVQRQISKDGSRKYLIRLAAGELVETVAIPSRTGRLSVCFSTQAGCAMGCAFCATGQGGLSRSLGAGEMADQVLVVARDFKLRVSNVVAMGQGEPFANYDAVLGALRIINDERLLGIGARHITVSTCGLLDAIHRFSEEPEQFTLAVSLHSAIQETRNFLMPSMVSQTLVELAVELRYYASATGRRPSLEYALIDGVTDTNESVEALIDFCKECANAGSFMPHVNLISLNPVEGLRFRPSSVERTQEFAAALFKAGVDANLRASRGADIQGACGQLVGAVSGSS